MKHFLLFVLFMSFSSLGFSKTWIAICQDGKNIQYNQSESGTGFLYMKVKDKNNKTSIYQMARLKKTFFNNTAICGTVIQNGQGRSGQPITQLCMNKSRRMIYVKYKHPNGNEQTKSGVYCRARIIVR